MNKVRGTLFSKWISRIIFLILFLVFVYMMTFSVYSNRYEAVVNNEHFNNFDKVSEVHMLGCLMNSRLNGINIYDTGLYFVYDDSDEENVYGEVPYSAINDISKYDDYVFYKYRKQLGLHGLLFSIMDKVMGYPSNIIALVRGLNSLLLSLFIAVILIWIKKEFGWFAFLLTAITSIYSFPLVLMGKDMYWSIWTMLIPFISMLIYLMRADSKGKKHNIAVLCAIAFLSIFLKAACGYELISTCLVSLLIPYIYYAIKRSVAAKVFVRNFAWISLFGLLGFAFSVFVHCFVFSFSLGSMRIAFESIMKSAANRTGFLSAKYAVSDTYMHSLNAPIIEIFKNYLVLHFPLFGKVYPGMVIGAFACAVLSSRFLKRDVIAYDGNKNKAMIVATFISLIAPFSWFVLAKGHSFNHIGIIHFIWYIPCAFMLIGYIGYIVGRIISFAFEFNTKNRA